MKIPDHISLESIIGFVGDNRRIIILAQAIREASTDVIPLIRAIIPQAEFHYRAEAAKGNEDARKKLAWFYAIIGNYVQLVSGEKSAMPFFFDAHQGLAALYGVDSQIALKLRLAHPDLYNWLVSQFSDVSSGDVFYVK